MTPKEKALELLYSFYEGPEFLPSDLKECDIEYDKSIKRTLICCDKIMSSIKWASDFNNEQRNYWNEVIKELNEL